MTDENEGRSPADPQAGRPRIDAILVRARADGLRPDFAYGDKFKTLNIYRFGERTYRFWSYPGAPNRVRPHEYVSLLEVTGWRDVRVVPLKRLADDTVRAVAPSLAPRFREPEIGLLGVMILARRPDALTSRPATRTSG